jgi:RNA-directed DNA polymerase
LRSGTPVSVSPNIKDWAEKKVRRHLASAWKQRGFGWDRWSRLWQYDTLKLFNGYRMQYGKPKVALAR